MEGSVVLIGEYGALLQYPAGLGVKLVEEPFGHIKSHSPKSSNIKYGLRLLLILKRKVKGYIFLNMTLHILRPNCTTVQNDLIWSGSISYASWIKEENRKRSKKRRKLNVGEESQKEYHLQIRERLLICYTKIYEAAMTVHYFPVHQTSCASAPSCTGSDIDFASLCNLASLVPTSDVPEQPVIFENDMESQGDNDVFGKVISNVSDQHLNISAVTKQFIIPPRSTFLLSNLTQINPLYEYATAAGHYDVIVIDPPWENRSAIRGKKYLWLPTEKLLDISLPRLAAKGAIVAVWVTNKRKLAMFVQHKLFPKWHVHYLTEWHWLKVTRGGDLIHDMDSVHKKPYEVVVIGHYIGKPRTEDVSEPVSTAIAHSTTYTEIFDSPPPPKQLCLNTDFMTANDTSSTVECTSENEATCSNSTAIVHSACYSSCMNTSCGGGCNTIDYTHDTTASFSAKDTEQGCRCTSARKDTSEQIVSETELYRPFAFMCVASQTHSQKPYLGDILTRYFNKDGRKLELFARNLLPDWTSWGNEVLKFQEQVM